jgi:hypothetical protein
MTGEEYSPPILMLLEPTQQGVKIVRRPDLFNLAGGHRVTRGRKGTTAQGGSMKNMLIEQALQQKKKDKRKESAHDKLYQDNKHMMNISRAFLGSA